MKKAPLFLFLFLSSPVLANTVTRVQYAGNKTLSVSVSTLPVTSSKIGDLLAIFVATEGKTVTSITDNLSQTWTQAPSAAGAASGASLNSDLWYVLPTASGVTSVYVHLNSSSPSVYLNALEYSGILAFDAANNANNSSSNAAKGPSLTAALSNELGIAYCFVNSNNVTAVNSPWNLVAIDSGGDGIVDYIGAPAGTTQAAMVPTTSQIWVSSGAMFESKTYVQNKLISIQGGKTTIRGGKVTVL